MTNGNTFLEFEEKNIERLEKDFIKEHQEEFKIFSNCLINLGTEDIIDKFIKENQEEWKNFIEEEFNNRLI